MEIVPIITGVSGSTPINEIELISVANAKYGSVELCMKSGMNIPLAEIKLHDSGRLVDALKTFEMAEEIGEKLSEGWNKSKLLSKLEELKQAHTHGKSDLIAFGINLAIKEIKADCKST